MLSDLLSSLTVLLPSPGPNKGGMLKGEASNLLVRKTKMLKEPVQRPRQRDGFLRLARQEIGKN